MTEPCASSTARLTMFSEAISSISWRWRPSSPRIAAATSGSACSSVAVKNESGAEAVPEEAWAEEAWAEEAWAEEAWAGGFIAISPPPQALSQAGGRSKVGGRSGAGGIAYRPPGAKDLRRMRGIYARYGGIPG